MNTTKDWREGFHEVRVFVSVPVEFTVTVKAPNDYEAQQEALTILNSMTREQLIGSDQYSEDPHYDRDSWMVLGIAESHGFDNTPEDYQLALDCAENVEDES
tara:strand:- start:825 stop:1130 length:306 start_codon:yes stop_codon:yes gene_type:complete